MALPSSMKIGRRVLVSASLALLLTISGVGQVMQESRGLKVDVGPTQEFRLNVGPLGRASMEAKLRGFIWDHWHEKRAGRIAARFPTIDSGPTTHTFYILPDKSGEWIVTSKVEEWCSWLCRLQKIVGQGEPTTTVERFHLLDRVEPNTEPRHFIGELPAFDAEMKSRIKLIESAAHRSPDKYRLFFRSTTTPTSNWLF